MPLYIDSSDLESSVEGGPFNIRTFAFYPDPDKREQQPQQEPEC